MIFLTIFFVCSKWLLIQFVISSCLFIYIMNCFIGQRAGGSNEMNDDTDEEWVSGNKGRELDSFVWRAEFASFICPFPWNAKRLGGGLECIYLEAAWNEW